MAELSRKEAEHHVKLRDAVRKLEKNPQFKLLIMTQFLEKYPLELVYQRCYASTQSNETRLKSVNDKITGVGEFREWMSTTIAQGNAAEEALRNADRQTELDDEEDGEDQYHA